MQLKISYHGGHSGEFCDHAADTKEQILQSYLDGGFTHVGISEHQPPYADEYLYPDEMENNRTADYLQKRFDKYFQQREYLEEKFSSKIHLLFGFETEFYGPRRKEFLTELVEKCSPDFLVASIHHVRDLPFDFDKPSYQQAVNDLGGYQSFIKAFFDEQYELFLHLASLELEIPIVVGHFDLIKIFSDREDHYSLAKDEIERNIKFAASKGFVFEVNARAFKKGLFEPYPNREILGQIKVAGAEITLGDDSHAASEVGLNYEKVLPIVSGIFDYAVAFEKQDGSINKIKLKL